MSQQFIMHLPNALAIEVNEQINDTGAGKITYPWNAAETQRMMNAPDGLISVYDAGREVFSFLLEDDEDDAGHDALTARPVTISGRGCLALFERAVILPEGGFGVAQPTGNTKRHFNLKSPGRIIENLLAENQAIGVGQYLSVSFDGLYDSAGRLWDKRISANYEIGVSLLELIANLCAAGVWDVRMNGLTLEAYVVDTVLKNDRPDVFVRRMHIANAPRKRSRRTLRSGLVGVGENGWTLYRYSPASEATYGKRLGRIRQGETRNLDALAQFTEREVNNLSRPHAGSTISLKLAVPNCPVPWDDFQVGDSIRSDTTVGFATGYESGYEGLRVQSIAVAREDSGNTTASVELNDVFEEMSVQVARKVQASTSLEDIYYITSIFDAVIGGIGWLYSQPGMADILGLPLSDEEGACPDGIGRFMHFERGSIYWYPGVGAFEVHGPIRDKWESLGWEVGLGYPTTNQLATPDGIGRANHFTGTDAFGASIYWYPGIGAHEIHGAIRAKWIALGWEIGFLGYPITDEIPTAGNAGRFTHFQGGSIYFLGSTVPAVAYEMHGDIRNKWISMGSENSILGYPMTDETTTPDQIGRFNHFQNGSIYWTGSLGAHSVFGAIFGLWEASGWEGGPAGYPTSDEYDIAGGRQQNFERGVARWTLGGGAAWL